MHIALLLVLILACPGCYAVQKVEPVRTATPMFKGVELYSWLDPATNNWRFVLLPGTNRNKFPDEIFGNKEIIGSVAELKEHLSLLASGESVFWLVPDSERFALPP